MSHDEEPNIGQASTESRADSAVPLIGANGIDDAIDTTDVIEPIYPEAPDAQESDSLMEQHVQEADALFREAMARAATPAPPTEGPSGYVTNARNAASTSDAFSFWAPADDSFFSVGSIVRHVGQTIAGGTIETYGIIVESEGQTLGLDDVAVHVYETDALPPLDGLAPAGSRRRPVRLFQAKVVSGGDSRPRPILDGPVYPVRGTTELLAAHGASGGRPKDRDWLDSDGIVLGFYEDDLGQFGIFAEERSRVLGPQQGHVVASGVPGAGKTSLFLTVVTALFAQLRHQGAVVSDGAPARAEGGSK